MKCSLFVFALLASLLVLSGCDASGTGEEEELTLSPDVLDVQVELEADSTEALPGNPPEPVDVTLNGRYTNTSSGRTLAVASIAFAFWNESEQIYNGSSDGNDLPPNTGFNDRIPLVGIDALSDIECYEYTVSVSPLLANGEEGSITEKEYDGTCPEGHPALQ